MSDPMLPFDDEPVVRLKPGITDEKPGVARPFQGREMSAGLKGPPDIRRLAAARAARVRHRPKTHSPSSLNAKGQDHR